MVDIVTVKLASQRRRKGATLKRHIVTEQRPHTTVCLDYRVKGAPARQTLKRTRSRRLSRTAQIRFSVRPALGIQI